MIRTAKGASIWVAAAAAALAFTACGGDSGTNSPQPESKAESKVFSQVESRINNDYYSTTFNPMKEISCEGEGIGADFTCEATNHYGSKLEISGKVKSDKTYTRTVHGKKQSANYLDFDWDVTHASISSDAIEKQALDEAGDRHPGNVESIDCPDGDIDVTHKAKVTCVATAEDGSERRADVRVGDEANWVSVEVGV